MEEYLEATTLHGFAYLQRRNSTCARLFWSITILAGFTLASYFLYGSLIDWEENQTITTLQSIATPIQHVQFPTVTVCPNEENPPDNWSFLEKFLNTLEFSSREGDDEEIGEKIRKDIVNNLLSELREVLLQKKMAFPNAGIWADSSPTTYFSNVITQTADWICQDLFNIGELRKMIVDEFAKGHGGFKSALEWSVEEDFGEDLFFECDNVGCCENWVSKPFFAGLINAGFFIQNSEFLGVGTFLANFANLTAVEIKKAKWSTFNLDQTIKSDYHTDLCVKMSSSDKFLHQYFKDLGIALGFSKNHSLSLFDLPSMLRSTFNSEMALNTQSTKDAFAYSQCEKDTMSKQSFHTCHYDVLSSQINWANYFDSGEPESHPCNPVNEGKCCNFWTTFLQHQLKPIMKVMRMASGRGQSHFNVTDFLQPFVTNLDLIRYPLNINTTDAYYVDSEIGDLTEARDKTSFLPICSYASKKAEKWGPDKRSCMLFEPVVTDLGICYSFNAEPIMSMLANSSFKESFFEAYQYDFLEMPFENSRGAGDIFALKFMVDNSRYLRKKHDTKPFKVLISSRRGYFDAFSVAKEVKPGFETTFDVQPIEVIGTDGLRDRVSEKSRNCKFPEEITQDDGLFRVYSQSSCEYECRIENAREECMCTPWNVPTPPSLKHPTICDLYGNHCFHLIMVNAEVIKSCTEKCPADCEDVRFSINKQEIPIDVGYECGDTIGSDVDGMYLTSELFKGGHEDYYPLIYEYHKLAQMLATNDTTYQQLENIRQIEQTVCHDIMTNDIAMVKIRLESNKYMKTIKDQRLTFADKLAAFGGTLGLCTGMSLLSMVEVAFWLMKIPSAFLKGMTKKSTRNTSRGAQ